MSLKVGHKGEAVKALQSQLCALGYRLAEDGIFGYNTLQAVRDFQKQKQLKVDGVAGPCTMAQVMLALGTLRIPETPHYQMSEFISAKDAETVRNGIPFIYYENLQTLMNRLEILRERIGGQPLVIRSGYRSPDYNKKVGGAGGSQHQFARAADIYVRDYAISTYELAQHIMADDALKRLFGGIGLGSVKNVHVDIRAVKNAEKPTLWWYGSKSWGAWERAT